MFMLYVYFNALEVLQWFYVLVRLDRMFESRGYLVHIMLQNRMSLDIYS